MSRFRLALVVTCLGLFLLAAAPGTALAERSSSIDAAGSTSEFFGGHIVRVTAAWSQGALSWMHSILAPEHGQIVPGTPPPPSPSPDPSEPPAPPADPDPNGDGRTPDPNS